jgi:hypothetical protein
MAINFDDLLSQIPMDQLARQLGVDERTARQATTQALPALLGGMQANAQDPAGAASLSSALRQHDDNLLDGGVDVGQVDTDDGDKIVRNVFGENRQQVVNQLGGLGGGGTNSGLIAKLLPLLAPIVMSYLAKQFTRQGGTAAGSPTAGGGGLEDLLGGLLGGQGQGQAGGIGDLLGGLLGGGRR